MVQSRRSVSAARRLLTVSRVPGTIEVRDWRQYERATERLAEQIAAEIPAEFGGKVHVSAVAPPGHLECFKASIELGVRGEVTAAEIDWASRQVERYGRDRATYRYTPVATAL